MRSAPQLSNRKEITDQRVSNCSDCKKGIFKHHKYLWTSRGLVHQECEDGSKIVT